MKDENQTGNEEPPSRVNQFSAIYIQHPVDSWQGSREATLSLMAMPTSNDYLSAISLEHRKEDSEGKKEEDIPGNDLLSGRSRSNFPFDRL